MAPDVNFLAVFVSAAPVPVRQKMQHGLVGPPGLIVEVVVFRKTAGIENTKMGTDARPVIRGWFTTIVKAGPGKGAGDKGPLGIDLPPSLRAERVTREPDIVGGHISLFFVVGIDAARTEVAGSL